MITKKHIALVANSTWNIYNFRLNVIRELLNRDFDVSVLAPMDEYIIYKDKFPEVNHIPLRALNRNGKHPLRDLALVEELRRKYKRIKPDLIIHYTHKPNIYGALAARINKIPSIGVVTGLGYPFLHPGFTQTIIKWFYKVANLWHAQVIFENEDDKTLFQDEGLLKRNQGLSIKGCGVNVEHFCPGVERSRNGITQFTFIGRLLYDKGIREYVQAAASIKQTDHNAKFMVIGDLDKDNPSSVNPDELTRWIHEDIIEYKGYVNDVRPFISSSDCIVLPSYREAIARSITESMAMGKPVIATDVAGCREAIDDKENGLLVPVKNEEALKEAMLAIMDKSNQELLDMGKRGREKTEEVFDDRLIAKKIVDIVELILD